MSSLVKLAMAFGAGALVMYLFDPVTGRRRRFLAGQMLAEGDDLEEPAWSRRSIDRLRDAQAQAEIADDERLEARIRSKLGRLVDRPGDVDVGVENGFVVLSGRVKVSELDHLIEEISALAGVDDVESRLTTRREPEAAGEEGSRH